jgi:hypothetical protein
VTVARAALIALAADDVHLRGDVVADGERAFVCARRAIAERLDETAEFVSVNARRLHLRTDRRIPVIDVFVGAADGGAGDADQDLAGTRFRHRTVANFGPFRTVESS